MRLIHFLLVTFLACVVLASPVPAISKRGPTKAAPAKAPKSAPPAKGKAPAGKAPAGKLPPCKGKKTKRANSPVADAWKNKGEKIGGGAKGVVYHTKFNGGAAVIKEIPAPWHTNAQKEAQHLKAVHQLLGWGLNGNEAAYIVMKYMGEPQEKAGITEAKAAPLRAEAVARYKKDFHMDNKDANPPNFVYHSGKAEIIDWDRGVWSGPGTEPPAPAPEEVDTSKCTVM